MPVFNGAWTIRLGCLERDLAQPSAVAKGRGSCPTGCRWTTRRIPAAPRSTAPQEPCHSETPLHIAIPHPTPQDILTTTGSRNGVTEAATRPTTPPAIFATGENGGAGRRCHWMPPSSEGVIAALRCSVLNFCPCPCSRVNGELYARSHGYSSPERRWREVRSLCLGHKRD